MTLNNPLTLNQLKYRFLNDDDGTHKPQVGRYSASALYSILKGYKKPEDFFKPDPIKEEHLDIVIRGMMAEDMLSRIFKETGIKANYGENQSKYEVKEIEGITLVTKPDVEFLNDKGEIIEVWECKYPREMVYEIPPKWKYQLELEYRATLKPVKLAVFSEPFNITLIDYIPSDKTWEEIKKGIIKFDKKVKLCQTKK